MKLNSSAQSGDAIFLLKPIGTGVLSTAIKLNIIDEATENLAITYMSKINSLGYEIGKLDYVNAVTDITGFGLLGHIIEICEGSNLNADVRFEKIRLIKGLEFYINEKKIVTSGGKRNSDNYREKVSPLSDFAQTVLNDPQSNGGLLVIVDGGRIRDFQVFLQENDLQAHYEPIGFFKNGSDGKRVTVL